MEIGTICDELRMSGFVSKSASESIMNGYFHDIRITFTSLLPNSEYLLRVLSHMNSGERCSPPHF